MNAVVVTRPGFLTTVQDLGRPGHAAAGVSASGAADPVALRIGNRLLGNDEAAPALEMTLVGGAFRFESDGVIALAGAEAQARLGDRPVAPWRACPVRAGETRQSVSYKRARTSGANHEACGPSVTRKGSPGR